MKNYIDYATTCFIDKDNELAGILEINENAYIDFDRKTVYIDQIDQGVSATKMALLEKLILASPSVVTYDSLFRTYYDSRYFDVEELDMQVLRNAISALKKFVRITNVSKSGYKIELPKCIKKFGSIRKCDVTDISELFPVLESGASEEECKEILGSEEKTLEFSEKFFHSGAQELADKDGETVINELKKLSGIFNGITTLNGISLNDDVIGNVYNLIVDGCETAGTKEILKIKGPLGSYKNRIMQYLYLAVAKNNRNILPFYIDIAYYEKIAENKADVSNDEIIEVFIKDFEEMKAIQEKYKNKTPLLMIDGVRDFSRGDEAPYYFISKKIKNLNCKLVVCMDGDFTVNNQHQFNVHPLASNKYRHYMRITSMNLHKRADSIEFIRNCLDISGVDVSDDVSPEKIYDSLVKLSFLSVDAYWLVYIVKYYQDNLLNPKGNISDLYSAICMSILGSGKKIDSAAELAYKFEFNSVDFDKNNPFFDIRWQLIRKHRSVLDYLIAKHYVRKISELDFKNRSREENIKNLSFFNMVLQKSITRFVVDMIGGNDDYEHKIMIIAENYYDILSLFGKSELTFWMVRLHNHARKKRCKALLKDYSKKEIQRYNDTKFKNPADKKNLAFLIRGISVSLIYENDEAAFRYYIKSLINDKTANTVINTQTNVGSKRFSHYLGVFPKEANLSPNISVIDDVDNGDIILLCSDGLTDMLSDNDIAAILSTGESTQDVASKLIRSALERGGKDNITVMTAFMEVEKTAVFAPIAANYVDVKDKNALYPDKKALGDCYFYGNGVEQDHKKAVEYYTISANHGNTDAQCALGHCYYHGYGVKKSYKKAFYWNNLAAEQGNMIAQYNLGYSYYFGHGVKKNYKKAFYWYTLAAEQGFVRAQFQLGVCYHIGKGTIRNYQKAVEWYTLAAKQDNSNAQYALGNCYYYGNGVQQDPKKAVEWYTLAAKNGNIYAEEKLKKITPSL